MIGSVLANRYRVLTLLGRGGMGSVYEGVQLDTGLPVAIKVMTELDTEDNTDLVHRFQREARATGTMRSTHVAAVLDAGEDQATGLPFLVMELLRGEDLQQLTRRLHVVSVDLALRITIQACRGLADAHAAGIVHRDVKPANLFLMRTGIARNSMGEARDVRGQRGSSAPCLVKVLDFGIAKFRHDNIAGEVTRDLTRTGSMLGSPHYMSPEQAQGLKGIDARTDVWSLGVVFYKLLTGRTPYKHYDTFGQLVVALCTQPPPFVQDFAPWVPPEVAAVVHQALRNHPAERYQSVADMLGALRTLLPGDETIRESMLVSLSTDERTQVAARHLPLGSRASAPTLALGPVPAPPSSSASPSFAPTNEGLARSRVTVSRDGGSSSLLRRTALPSALALAGLLAFWRLSAGHHAWPADGVSAVGAPGSSVSVEVPDVSATRPIASVVPMRTVTVTVAPADAAVDVDGVTTEVRDGLVVLMGAPGSVHTVDISSGGRKKRTTVVVTETGALPDRVLAEEAATTTNGTSAGKRAGAVTRRRGPGSGAAEPERAKPIATSQGGGLHAAESFE